MKKTKILFYGDGITVATGFGTVSRNILVPLSKTGKYDIRILGINYWGDPNPYHDLPMWPVGLNKEKDPYGRKYVQERIMQEDFDVLFMIQDSFILDFIGDLIPKLRAAGKKFSSVVYFPIDGVPKKSWVEAMAVADYPVTYTQFGYKECVKACPDIEEKLSVIPHGINTDDFHPLGFGDIWAFRRKYFGPLADSFIITNVNRNQQRKDIPRFLMAFKEFKKECPNAMAYLHCAAVDQGWDLVGVIEALGLKVNKDVVFPYNFNVNKGFPVEVLNLIYNASDVVASSTLGEGWGLAQVEAMAARTPVISPDNTACTEILGDDRGLLVPSGDDIEHFAVLPHDNEVVRPLVNVGELAKAFSRMYNDDVLRLRLTDNAYSWVTGNLIWDKHIVPKWMDIIDRAAESKSNDSAVSVMEV